MTNHATGTREEWLAARLELLEAEKELTRRSDELARRRQELPWVRIDKEYRFETDEGSASLADLFRGRSQLLVYHFMFGYGARLTDLRRGCTGCSLVTDHFDGVTPHLNGRDITLVCASIAPAQELHGYKPQKWAGDSRGFRRSGATSTTTSASPSPRSSGETAPTTTSGMSTSPSRRRRVSSVFALRTALSTTPTPPSGVEALMGAYQFLDLAPWGRNEDGLESWWRRHDEYPKG